MIMNKRVDVIGSQPACLSILRDIQLCLLTEAKVNQIEVNIEMIFSWQVYNLCIWEMESLYHRMTTFGVP